MPNPPKSPSLQRTTTQLLGWSALLRSLCSPEGVRPQDMACLRAPNGRAIIIPNSAPKIARSSLLDYRVRSSRKESLATNMLVPMLRSGSLFRGMAPNLTSTFDLGERHSSIPPLWPLFESTLNTALGHFSTVLRTPGPDWTPIIHLFDPDGERVAIAKIGFSDRARSSIRREATALQSQELTRVSWITARSLGSIEGDEFSAVLMSPLPTDISSFNRRLDADLLDEIASLPRLEDDARHPEFLQEATAQLGLDLDGSFVERINADVPRGRCHGDLVPWNMAHTGGRLVLWDWEYSFHDAPVGFDAIQSRYRLKREQGFGVAEALLFANQDSQSTLVELGLGSCERDDVCAIHGIDAAVRLAAGVDVEGSSLDDARRALTVLSPVKRRLLHRV